MDVCKAFYLAFDDKSLIVTSLLIILIEEYAPLPIGGLSVIFYVIEVAELDGKYLLIGRVTG